MRTCKREALRLICTVCLLAGLAFVDHASAIPILSVQPVVSNVVVPGSVAVSVSVSSAEDLFAFQFDVAFDPAILAATSTIEGPFLLSGGPTFFIPGSVDNVTGRIAAIAGTLVGALPGVNGDGVLAQIEFSGLRPGISGVALSNVSLIDAALNDIPAIVVPGAVNVMAALAVREPPAFALIASAVILLAWVAASSRRLHAGIRLE